MTLNVHLDQLNYLRCIADSPSWTAAAKSLYISQPALSQSLRELERRLDVTLFEKVGRKQHLTALGWEVVEFARAVLDRSEHLSGRLEALRRGESGTLRLGIIDAACLYLMPKSLREFQLSNSDIDLQLHIGNSEDLLEGLKQFKFDMVVVVGPIDEEGLSTQMLINEGLYVFKPVGDERHLSDARWILYPKGSHTRDLIDTALIEQGWIPKVALESGNPQVLRQMVEMGSGWAVLPASVAGNDLARHYTQTNDTKHDGPLLRRPILVVRRKHAAHDSRISKLLEMCHEEIAAVTA